jgi:hypothetical protein
MIVSKEKIPEVLLKFKEAFEKRSNIASYVKEDKA